MSEEIREEELSFEEMIDASLKPVYNGKVVKGIVTGVSPSEIQVDIGTKQTGFVKLEELTNDPSRKALSIFPKSVWMRTRAARPLPPLSRAARSWRASSPRPTPAALWCW